MNIYISNLSTKVNEQELHDLFSQYGKVHMLHIKKADEGHNYTRGFVMMYDGGQEAVGALNGCCLKERWIAVQEFTEHDFLAAGAYAMLNRESVAA